MSDARQEPIAVTTQRHLTAIADLWPELEQRLGGSGNQDGEKISAPPPGSRPPIDTHVADVMHQIQDWVVYLCRVLLDETDWKPPAELDTPGLLRDIGRWRVGHFTAEHYDEMARLAFIDDAEEMHSLALRTARPSGARKIRLNVHCTHHDTNDDGESIACPGEYFTLLIPNRGMQDMVCNENSEHRMTPLQWQRAMRSGIIAAGVMIA